MVKKIMSKKALISGGTGFIGSHVAEELLKRDWKIQIIDKYGFKDYQDLDGLKNHKNITFHEIDLNNFDQIASITNDFDYIFHFAAKLGVADVTSEPYEVLKTNISTTENIINYSLLNQNLSRFIFASTSEVYSGTQKHFNLIVPTPESEPLTIDNVSSPRSSYMLSKSIGESLCHFSRLPVTILRPFNIYGSRAGIRHVIPQLLEKVYKAKSGDLIEVFSPDHTRAFCHIDDATMQIMSILDNEDCKNETLNLGNQSREITMLELAKICIEVSGKDLGIKKLGITEGSPKRRAPSMEKSQNLIDCLPKVTLEEGIARTYSWYCNNFFAN
jgi:nucleoside-diphosphate-sugar epimerase